MAKQKQKFNKRLIVVSNRLPIVISKENDQWGIQPGSGGLITALTPILKESKSLWIGWPGTSGKTPIKRLLDQFGSEQGYKLVGIPLSQQEIERYYWGFSNGTLWPLLHDLLGYCKFNLEDWQTYVAVNKKFARAIKKLNRENDIIWVHDYQLSMVGYFLKKLKVRQPLAYFHHIPFPSLDLLRRLPWKTEYTKALLAFDLLGFQTLRDRRNFVNTVTSLISEASILQRQRNFTLIKYGERIIQARNLPISIDFNEFNNAAHSPEVQDAAWYLHENLHERQLMLGIDRLDYTKGIPERFLAFELALEKYPELKQKISLLQVVVPSRTLDSYYQKLKEQLEQMTGRINARFGDAGWIPIHYIFRSLDNTQLIAHYRTSEIAFITPLRDGMNLVAKEYCACSVENNGVLILSEFAGAADQLGEKALLVNPYDIEKTADTIYQAFTMPLEERQQRMRWLRNQIQRNDVHQWLRYFMRALDGVDSNTDFS
ncbi:MAG: trehalose-6-phosphate synthase [Desulfobacterales bacterium]|jgi:trehalose 6-phosphate synthase|nr:trehalose-6-phosphate synthase [Desulfobacterales bacterium]